MSEHISIIFCYRDRDLIRVKNSLDSLALQTDPNFSVLFVDYGSSDEYKADAEKLCGAYKFCKYIYVDSRGKFWNRAEALNYGILNCDNKWVFTVDVDLVFKRNFVMYLHKEATENEAKFFAVGYLTNSQTEKLDVKNVESISSTKSKDFALGMVLASKEILVKVDGYNTFYAIWGMEDNDIKSRMEKKGIKTHFINEVHMLHQYHFPASTYEGGVPEGWIQFSKDHFAANGEVIGLDKMEFPPKRPAKNFSGDKEFIKKNISGRILFIRHQLIDAIAISPEKKLVLVIDTAAHRMGGSGTSGLINFTNAMFKMGGVHAHVDSNYKDQYVTHREIRDEVYFAVKSMGAKLADHYIEESLDSITLSIVKH